MASNNTICAKNINCDALNCNNISNTPFLKIAKATFDNTSSSDNFLKNAAFFQIMFPANIYIININVYVAENDIVVATASNADTLINIADGTNAVFGSATSITIGSPPGSAGVLIADDDSSRTKGSVLFSMLLNPINADGRLSNQDRLLTGVIYHDANGQNDGLGDAALNITDLDKVVLYVEIVGFKVPQ